MLLKLSMLAAIAGTFLLLAAGSACADDMSDMADWCATQATAPSSIVICSDQELRRLAVIRNKIFADARLHFSEDEMKELSTDQNHWIHEYTAACGVSVDGLPVRLPVSQEIIDCYKQAGRERITELVRDLRDVIPNYQVPSVSGGPVPAASPPLPSSDQAERERAAEDARRQLQTNGAREKLAAKLKDLGFLLLQPVDLDLDWKNFMANNTKVAVLGTYVEANDVEVLSTPDNRDQPTIRLYTNDASRAARKIMLECRNSNFAFPSCQMIVGATIQGCIRNKGELNEKEVPCLKVQEAYVMP